MQRQSAIPNEATQPITTHPMHNIKTGCLSSFARRQHPFMGRAKILVTETMLPTCSKQKAIQNKRE
eukprot:scaffold20966_cov18-Prasinocladus_malaysianus.AAC.1